MLDKWETNSQGRPRCRPRRDDRLQPGRHGRVHLPSQGDGAEEQLPRGPRWRAARSPGAAARQVLAGPDGLEAYSRRTPAPAAGSPGSAPSGPRSRTAGARSDEPGHHRAEQRARVVELVEPGDHCSTRACRLPSSAAGAGDPGGGGEAQRRDHRDGGAEDREAGHRHRPGRRNTDDTARAADATRPPTRSTRTGPNRATKRSPASRMMPLASRYGNIASATTRRGVEDVVEVVRSPGQGRGVDHVEEHHRGADQHERSPRHVDAGGDTGDPVRGRNGANATRAGTRRPGRPSKRKVGGREGDRRADHATERPGAVERRQDRPAIAVLEGDGLHVGGGVDHAERDAVEARARRRTPSPGATASRGTATAIAKARPQQRGAAMALREDSAATEPTPASRTIISNSSDSGTSDRSQCFWNAGSRVVRLMKTRPWVRNRPPATRLR